MIFFFKYDFFKKACKDTQTDPDFCIVARVEAFIAGWGLDEALKRAEAYRNAGALILGFLFKSFVYMCECFLYNVINMIELLFL